MFAHFARGTAPALPTGMLDMTTNETTTNETALTLRSDDRMTGGPAPAPGAPGSPEFEATAMYMASEFAEAMAQLAGAFAAMEAATKRMNAAFDISEEDRRWNRFGVEVEYRRTRIRDVNEFRALMEREAWGTLVGKLGIKNVMSVKKAKEFDDQLDKGELPPICVETITQILLGLAGQADQFARDAAVEVFEMLRPGRGGWETKYKTNNPFRVGRKVILTGMVETTYNGGFHIDYRDVQELTAIDGIFHLLDGKGIMRENRGPLVNAIEATQKDKSDRGETEYFRFRCCKNRNLHLWFKREDLVMELNMLAVGERVLGADIEEEWHNRNSKK